MKPVSAVRSKTGLSGEVKNYVSGMVGIFLSKNQELLKRNIQKLRQDAYRTGF
jgi:acylphosphatase